MFNRPHHNAIAQVLKSLDAELLLRAKAWFGGGTAIVLNLGEYRESVDIDFLCSSKEGYRLLREATFGGSFDKVLASDAGITVLREVRADQYGIRTQLEAAGTRVKFEIVREARVDLSGEMDPRLGVPMLTRADMYCEKLLANADRYADTAVLSRDMIDLSMMISRWGPIPDAAWGKAEAAYGQTVRTAYDRAVAMIRNPIWMKKCVEGMAIEEKIAEEIVSLHGGYDAPE
jgi:nucleotidyltransferase AbiEii toxin of type IV toxin-antitoxin system